VVALLDRDRSLVRAAAAATPAPDPARPAPPVFAGIRGGVGRLPAALVESAGAEVRTGATVRDLAARPGGGWNLVVGETRDPQVLQFDGVVLATPARATARLLSDVAPRAALDLARIEYASVAVVTMAFRACDVPQVPGSGFLVPPVDGRAVKAATFSFAKWDWVRAAGGEGPDAVLVLRCSLGRHGEARSLQHTDEELVDIAVRDLTDAIGLSVRPLDSHVQRWGGALPQYEVGHLDRVGAIRAELSGLSGLEVCGSAYDGLGIPACIATAHRAADGLLASLRERASSRAPDQAAPR
jgi:oxygen-dependent protoporphyrinogen oxidase